MALRSALLAIGLLGAAGCTVTGYSPYPIDFADPLPKDAFQRCRAVLRQHFDLLDHTDAESFLLQTQWLPIEDPPGERRASVFRDPIRPNSLNVVVELRRLSIPWFGLPRWTESVGDDQAERELAELLRQSLTESDASQ